MIQRLRTLLKRENITSHDLMYEADETILLGHHMWQALELVSLRMYEEYGGELTFAVQHLESSDQFVQDSFALRHIIDSVVLDIEKVLQKHNADSWENDQEAIQYDVENVLGDHSIYRNAMFLGKYMNFHSTQYLDKDLWQQWSSGTSKCPFRTNTPEALRDKYGYATQQLEFQRDHRREREILFNTPDAALSGGGLMVSTWLHYDIRPIMQQIVETWHDQHPVELRENTARLTIKMSLMLLFSRALRNVELPQNAPFTWCAPFLVTHMQQSEHIVEAWRDALYIVQTKNRQHRKWESRKVRV